MAASRRLDQLADDVAHWVRLIAVTVPGGDSRDQLKRTRARSVRHTLLVVCEVAPEDCRQLDRQPPRDVAAETLVALECVVKLFARHAV